MKKRKLLFVLAVLLPAGLIGLIVFMNSRPVYENIVVDYKNLASIKIVDISNAIDGDTKEATGEVKSGEPVSLKSGYQYRIVYEGEEGFESGSIDFSLPGDKQEFEINPNYSSAKLSQMLSSEVENIRTVLKNSYRNIGLYEMQPGRLYLNGEWYGTTLKYIGSDVFNSDSLRLVMHKENGRWKIATDPPDITLSKYYFPNVPEEVLRRVNALPDPKTRSE